MTQAWKTLTAQSGRKCQLLSYHPGLETAALVFSFQLWQGFTPQQSFSSWGHPARGVQGWESEATQAARRPLDRGLSVLEHWEDRGSRLTEEKEDAGRCEGEVVRCQRLLRTAPPLRRPVLGRPSQAPCTELQAGRRLD